MEPVQRTRIIIGSVVGLVVLATIVGAVIALTRPTTPPSPVQKSQYSVKSSLDTPTLQTMLLTQDATDSIKAAAEEVDKEQEQEQEQEKKEEKPSIFAQLGTSTDTTMDTPAAIQEQQQVLGLQSQEQTLSFSDKLKKYQTRIIIVVVVVFVLISIGGGIAYFFLVRKPQIDARLLEEENWREEQRRQLEELQKQKRLQEEDELRRKETSWRTKWVMLGIVIFFIAVVVFWNSPFGRKLISIIKKALNL